MHCHRCAGSGKYLIVFPEMSAQLCKLVEEAEGARRQLHKIAWDTYANNWQEPSAKRLQREVELALKRRLFYSHIKHEVR